MKKTIPILFVLICLALGIVFLFFNFVVFKRYHSEFVEKYSTEYNLSVPLVFAIIKSESNFDKTAVSKAGAKGLMQLLPSTAKWIAETLGDVFDEELLFYPSFNIKYGCFYLNYLIDKFEYVDVAVCAYNAGESAVRAWLNEDGSLNEEKINYQETKKYLEKVRFFEKAYSSDIILYW